MPPNTEEDKVRGLSPYDFKRLLIALLGNADIPGVKLLGKKSDNTFENIKTDDEGRLQVYDPKVGSLISYEGITTADGAGDGSTLIDSVLTTKPDYNGNLVIITSGDYAGQARDINGATTGGTVTPSSAFGGQIVEGTTFTIIGIRTTPAEVAAIEAKLDNPDYGLAAIDHILDSHTPNYAGHIYYVDGTNGDDANDGSIHNPFKTIAHAISVAASGDRIKVKAGTYDEAINMNLAGLELICEQGTILSNSTPGTVLVVSADYCRVVGAILSQAGQTGLQITGNFASIENCLAFGCLVGFDIGGAENHTDNCRSIQHTGIGFKIDGSYGIHRRLVAAGAGAVRGIYLSANTADRNHFHDCHTLGNTTAGWEVVAGADNNLFSECSTAVDDGARVDNGANNTWDEFSEGSQITAGQSRDQDLKDIYDAIAATETKLDKLAGETPVSNSVTANWQSGTGTSGEAGADLVTLGANDTRYKLHSLLVNISALTAGATITVKLFMQINGTERKVYSQAFTQGTDPDGLWIVNGTVGIHEALRVEVQSDNAGDNGLAIEYDYMLEAM